MIRSIHENWAKRRLVNNFLPIHIGKDTERCFELWSELFNQLGDGYIQATYIQKEYSEGPWLGRIKYPIGWRIERIGTEHKTFHLSMSRGELVNLFLTTKFSFV